MLWFISHKIWKIMKHFHSLLYHVSFQLDTKSPFDWNNTELFTVFTPSPFLLHSWFSNSEIFFFFFRLRNRPHGGKWSLVGVLSWALSNKGNYSRLFKLMDPTEGSDSPLLDRNRVLTSCDTPDQRSPHAGWPQTTAAIKKSQHFDNARRAILLSGAEGGQHFALIMLGESEIQQGFFFFSFQ